MEKLASRSLKLASDFFCANLMANLGPATLPLTVHNRGHIQGCIE